MSSFSTSLHRWRHLIVPLLLAWATTRGEAAAWDWWEALELKNLEGEAVHPEGPWMAVVFLSEECPVANASIPTLNQLQTEFGSKGISIVGAYCDPTLEKAAMVQHRKAFALRFQSVDDRQHRLVKRSQATYTPEVVVFSETGEEIYRGRIDNRVEDFGVSRPTATRRELFDVLTALARGERGPFPAVPGFGCSIPQPIE